jgi:phage major head subunit gpT-like protein
MEISAANLAVLFTGFDTMFQKGFIAAPSYYEKISSITRSSTSQTVYPWLKRTTGFRKWLGDRVLQALEATAYTIVNETYEDTVGIERERIEDDEYGTYEPVITQLGWDTKTHPDQLIFGMIKAAATGAPVTIGEITMPVPIGYDGQAFFSATHPVGPGNQPSRDTTVSNINNSGSGAFWFLVDGARPLKPFIFQKRREYAVTRMNTVTDEMVFSQRVFRYGVDARVAAGVGLWQLAYASNTDLSNPANYAAAIAAIRGFKSDAGVPFGGWNGPPAQRFLVVPPSLEEVASQLLMNQFGAGAGAGATVAAVPMSNIYYNQATLIVSEWLV